MFSRKRHVPSASSIIVLAAVTFAAALALKDCSGTAHAQPALPELAQATTGTNGTNKVTGIVGRPLVTATVSLAWNDERLVNTNVAGYGVYCGTNPLAMPLVATITKWTADTNGQVSINLTNISTREVYYASVAAFDDLGDEPADSTDIEFVAENYLLAAPATNGVAVTFMTFTNHSYSLMSAPTPAGPWSQLETFPVGSGVVATFPQKSGPKQFYRLKTQ